MDSTYRSILCSLRTTTLDCHQMTFVLETLRGDETLDSGSLGIWFLSLGLRLDFAADDEAADLVIIAVSIHPFLKSRFCPALVNPKPTITLPTMEECSRKESINSHHPPSSN